MGLSILDLVLGKLREAGFTADAAFPGQDGPVITEPVAAVHIENVDRAGLTVTVGVHINSPGARGGTACELEALRATEVLRWAGAECVQKACRYDGDRRVYAVEILATFTGITGTDSWDSGPGFRVRIGTTMLTAVRRFTAQMRQDYQAEYAIGEEGPVGYSRKKAFWELTLEELYPVGSPEILDPASPFSLMVTTGEKTELYENCHWTSVRRQFTREGLLRVRTGVSDLRKEI